MNLYYLFSRDFLFMWLNEVKDLMRRICPNGDMFYSDMLLEVQSPKDAYQLRYQQQFPNEEDFNYIISYDPTTRKNAMGKYSEWLLKQYLDGKISDNNLNDARELLTNFDRLRKKLPKGKQVITAYPDLESLRSELDGVMSNREKVRNEKKSATKFYEDDTWLVVIPHTIEASRKYGANTKWCTTDKESDEWFNHYNEQGPLYININKKTGDKYQFHFETNNFMDAEDDKIYRPIGDEIGLSKSLIKKYIKLYNDDYQIEDFTENQEIVDDIVYDCEEINEQLKNGVSLFDIFNDVDDEESLKNFDIYMCRRYQKYAFIRRFDNGEYKMLINQFFDYCYHFDKNSLCADVGINGLHNALNAYGEYIIEKWLPIEIYTNLFTNNMFVCSDNKNKENYLKLDGTFLLPNWVDNCERFIDGWGEISVGNKLNLVNPDGNLISDTWFDDYYLSKREFLIGDKIYTIDSNHNMVYLRDNNGDF